MIVLEMIAADRCRLSIKFNIWKDRKAIRVYMEKMKIMVMVAKVSNFRDKKELQYEIYSEEVRRVSM